MPLDGDTTFEVSLLPPNASRYMRAMEAAMQLPEELWEKAGLIASAKELIPDDVLPFLIWEYGLEPLTEWLPDLRELLAEGRPWQRVRGTDAALVRAYSWVDFEPVRIEHMPRTTWWDTFQLEFEEPETDPDRLDDIFRLTRLSKEAHSDIIRVYTSDYDVRAITVNSDQLSVNGYAYINDWSGVYLRSEWPKISFGANDMEVVEIGAGGAILDMLEAFDLDVISTAFGFKVNADLINGAELVNPTFVYVEWEERDWSELFSLGSGLGYETGPWPEGFYGSGGAQLIGFIDFGAAVSEAHSGTPLAEASEQQGWFEALAFSQESRDTQNTVSIGDETFGFEGETTEVVDTTIVVNAPWMHSEYEEWPYGVALGFSSLGWVIEEPAP